MAVLRELVVRREKAYATLPASRLVAPAFFAPFGGISFSMASADQLTSIAILMGISFIVVAVAMYSFNKKACGRGGKRVVN